MGGLDFPAAFTVAPDGRIFYGERFTGEIRIFDPRTSSNSLFFTIPNVPAPASYGPASPNHAAGGEQGLLGLALHPDYPSAPYVYAFATREFSGIHRNQILRITASGGTGFGMKVLLSEDAIAYHNGGRILFGPDKKLYAVIGERGEPANAQNLSVRVGKILRMTPAGTVPADNPYAGSYVFAYGIRNSYGFDFDPQTSRLWETENGPHCNDELNMIVARGNYGWGHSQTCATPPAPPKNTHQDRPSPIHPKRWFNPVIAPTGAAFCSGCGLGTGSGGRLFFGAWKTGEVRKVTLGASRAGVASQSVVYKHPSGVLSLETGPDGAIYFSDVSGIYKLVLTA